MKQLRLRGLFSLGVSAALAATALVGLASQASAYQPVQSNLYVATNPSGCNKTPCVLYPKSAQLPDGRLVAGFEDSEGAVVGQTLPIYKSDDDGTTWSKLTSLQAPASLTSDSAYANYTSNWTNPNFYVLPQDLGSLKAGTLLLADVVSGYDAAPNPGGNGNRQNIAIVLYASTDNGSTWNVQGIIATGPNQAHDPVWEPYLMMYQGQLVCYYSDENDYLGYNATTGVATLDPDNATATDSGGQVLVHRTWTGSGAWSAPVVDAPGLTVDMGGGKSEIGGGRPGMTNVVQTSDGKWMMTYEYWGGGANIQYRTSDSPLTFFKDTDHPITALPVASRSATLAQGGSPVIVRLGDGRLVYNAAGSGDVWVDATGSSTGTWQEYHTSVAAGYSRDLQYDSNTRRIVILQATWSGGSVGPVHYGEADLGDSAGVYYTLVNRETGQVLSPENGDTQDAAFTGNVPDIATQARNDATTSQWWHLVAKTGGYTLLNKGGGRALGIWQGNATQGAQLAQWVDDSGTDKIWNVIHTSDGYIELQSTANTSLYVTSAAAGSVSLQTAATDTSQQWQLVPDFTTAANATFKLVDHGTGKVLGIYAGSTAAGAAAVQWTDTGALNQSWRFTSLAGGSLKISNGNSADVLGIYAGSTAAGAAAVQWTDTGAADQQWTLVPSGPYYVIQNTHSGLVLDIQAGSSANGAAAVQQATDGSANQQWQLIQVSGG